MRTTQEVLDHHLQCFGEGDIDGLLEDYDDDSVMITPMGTIDNVAALREVFTGLIAEFGQEGVEFNMEGAYVHGDMALICWNASTPNNAYEFATDTFVVKNGKILRQTFSGRIVPKG